MFRMYAFLSVAHTNTECATTLIVDGRSISLLFIFFPLIKPGEEAPALQSILLTQPPHPQFPVGGVFLAPATRLLPCQVRHVTVAAHGLPVPPPTSTPILCRPVSPLTVWEHPTTSLAHLSCSFLLRSQQPKMTISEACTQLRHMMHTDAYQCD